MSTARVSLVARVVGAIGAFVIYRLIQIFGRTHRRADVEWIMGPIGGPVIGDAPYREVADEEGLSVERHAEHGGLVPDFGALASDDMDPSKLHPMVRDFYEHTARYAMDVWSQTFFPAKIVLYLLVKTISRQVNQLNFPLSPLDTSRGMSSEIITMKDAKGAVRYTGWFRTVGAAQTDVLYTGFYMTQRVPGESGACVKVVFPMPNGNATVVLRPRVLEGGALELDSSGKQFGSAGFYRVQKRGKDRLRVWHIRTLKEHFRVFVDDKDVLRCDHTVRFLGLPVLSLHYKIFSIT